MAYGRRQSIGGIQVPGHLFQIKHALEHAGHLFFGGIPGSW
jgi:hypothetical protein